jgi:flavin-dependent dehydrogenase
MTIDFDVAVIGAGLAGLQCARLLARRRLRVLIVDRKASLDSSVHTTGIFVRRTLEDFDLPEDCLGPSVRHVTLYSPGLRELQLESPHAEFRVGRMGKLYNYYLSEAVAAGAVWCPSTRFVGAKILDGSCRLELENNRRNQKLVVRYLVGADGARSRVAEALGLDANREWIVGVEDVFRSRHIGSTPRFHCLLDPELAPGYLAWLVDDGEEVHLGVGGYAERFEPLNALKRFRAIVEGRLLDSSSIEHVERRGGRIPVGGVLRRIANAGGLLVGDAAGAVSPLTAGGLDPCMRLSAVAADVIERYLCTNDLRELSIYSGEQFRAHFNKRLWMRRVLSEINRPVVLEAACAIMRLPLFKTVAWNVFFSRGSFPDVQRPDSMEIEGYATVALKG